MNTQTAHLPQHVADAIEEARRAESAMDRAQDRLNTAQQAHYDADTAYRAADAGSDDEYAAWDQYNDSIDALCAAARQHTEARLHLDQTRAALERIWTEHLQTRTNI